MNTFAISGLLCVDQFFQRRDIDNLFIERVLRWRDCRFIALLEFLKPVGDIWYHGHLVLHAVVSRACATEVCPAPPGVTRREPPVLDKDMDRVHLPEFSDDPV